MALVLPRPHVLPLPRLRAPRGGMSVLLAIVLLMPVVLGGQDSAAEQRLTAAVGPHQFDLVGWELRNLAARAGRIAGALIASPSVGDSGGALSAYLSAADADSRALARGPAEAAIDAEITREALD